MKKIVTVNNINKHGERFDPASYVVTRAENPEVYKLLERMEVVKK